MEAQYRPHMRLFFDFIEYFNEDTIDLDVIQKTLQGKYILPRVKWYPNPYTYYTLLLFDFDAPNGPYVHWLKMNILEDWVSTGQAVIPYKPPNPPSDKYHHYVLILYSQSCKLTPYQIKGKFSLEDFDNYYGPNLKKVDSIMFMTRNKPIPLWYYKKVDYTVKKLK